MNMNSVMPKARSSDLIVQEMDGETLVYDLASHQTHCLNRTAAAVWRLCDGATTVSAAIAAVQREVHAEADLSMLALALDQLEAIKLIERVEVEAEAEAEAEDLSALYQRRAMLKKVGKVAGAAILIPAIASVVAPRPAQAASCRLEAVTCSTTTQCCPGLVCSSSTNTCVLP